MLSPDALKRTLVEGELVVGEAEADSSDIKWFVTINFVGIVVTRR